MTADNM